MTPVNNQPSQPSDPNNDPYNYGTTGDPTVDSIMSEYGDDSSTDTSGLGSNIQSVDQYMGTDMSGDSGTGQPLTVDGLRQEISDLTIQLNQNTSLNAQDKSDVARALQLYKSELNAVIDMPPQQQNAKLSEIEANLVYLQSSISTTSDSSWGGDLSTTDPATMDPNAGGDNGGLVASKEVQDLLSQIQDGERVIPDGSDLTKAQCVTQLQQALQNIKKGDFQSASDTYNHILQEVGGIQSPTDLAGTLFGATPSKVDGDNIFYDCKDGTTSLQLNAPENTTNPKNITIDNATDVSITPANAGDTVNISHDGSHYVVTVGNDTFQVNDAAKLNIVSDHVTGDVDNKEGNITVGASEATTQKYVSANTLSNLASQISAGANEVGPSFSTGGDTKNSLAKTILNDMATAMAETDPQKKSDDWTQVGDDLDRLQSQGEGTGDINDIAQVVFNALYEKLGEQGLKDALQQGLIPKGIASKISDNLTINPGENTNSDSKDNASGGPDWTHQTSSDFLKQNSGGSSGNS